jgi:hypothetical protein
MCDTFVALADVTKNGDVIFGKNQGRSSETIVQVERGKIFP